MSKRSHKRSRPEEEALMESFVRHGHEINADPRVAAVWQQIVDWVAKEPEGGPSFRSLLASSEVRAVAAAILTVL
jgi:hypothetical protein